MLRALLLLAGIYFAPIMATAATPPMPPTVVLIVCQTEPAGDPDQNEPYTHSQNLQWATKGAMMVCRRQEVQMMDLSAEAGADPKPFTQMDCWRAGLMLGATWDAQHPNSKYRFWKVGCPVPMMDDRGTADTTDDILVGWKLPDCGRRETVICETDTEI